MFKALSNVQQPVAGIVSVESLLEADDSFIQATMDLSSLDDDFHSLESLNDGIDNLYQLQNTIKTHGISKQLLAFADNDGVLSQAIPAIPSYESFNAESSATSAESIAACEGIGQTIKDTLSRWFAKAWNMVVAVGAKLGSWLKAAAEKIVAATKFVAGKVWDATKATGHAIKAHPVAATLVIVGIAVAISAAIPGLLVGAAESPTTYQAFVKNFGGKIAGIFKSKGLTVAEQTAKDVANFPSQVITVETEVLLTPEKLGFIQANWQKLTTSVGTLFGENGSIYKAYNAVRTWISNTLKSIKSTPDATKAGWMRRSVTTVWNTVYTFFKNIFTTVGSAVMRAVGVFTGLFKSKAAVAAA